MTGLVLGLMLLTLTGCAQHWANDPPVTRFKHIEDWEACVAYAKQGTGQSMVLMFPNTPVGYVPGDFDDRQTACMKERGYRRAGFMWGTEDRGWKEPKP